MVLLVVDLMPHAASLVLLAADLVCWEAAGVVLLVADLVC